jgi:hypothetical protein
MLKLTRPEEAFLEAILKEKKRKLEEFLEDNGDSFEAYFVKNESLPMLKKLLEKIEI